MDGAVQVGGFDQTQKADRDETIGRLTWTRQNLAGFSFEAGAEAVLNTLDNTTELFDVEEDGSQDQDRPADRQRQGEGEARRGLRQCRAQAEPSLRVDAGMRYEYSHLTVTGDA